ncbi:MAG: hypothetical protein Q8O37_11750, partial [Sulfuricellaceae bacterium]|nr:hypothetical protein [Sulfuricellaceae bacterium]
DIGANRETGWGWKAELFWGRIGIWASTSSHFLRICFLITRILSNAYFVIRPVCAKFGLCVNLLGL